jgi:hypothetical protein
MASTPDARAFEIVSAPLGTSGAEFGAVAHAAASVDTLEGFLRDMKSRYPDAGAISAATVPPPPVAPLPGAPSVSAQPPQTRPVDPDLPPIPPPRAAGRTAQIAD